MKAQRKLAMHVEIFSFVFGAAVGAASAREVSKGNN